MVGILLDASLLGLGLSMDAAAVSMTDGMGEPKLRARKAALIAAFFGVFQGVMPLIGYLAGSAFTAVLTKITPYLALVILGIIGGRMLYEGIRHGKECEATRILGLKMLLVQAFATSIDALAVGLVLVPLGLTQVLVTVSVIAAVTFVLSFASVYIGKKLGCLLSGKAEIAGGIILILIGLKIFLEGVL